MLPLLGAEQTTSSLVVMIVGHLVRVWGNYGNIKLLFAMTF